MQAPEFVWASAAKNWNTPPLVSTDSKVKLEPSAGNTSPLSRVKVFVVSVVEVIRIEVVPEEGISLVKLTLFCYISISSPKTFNTLNSSIYASSIRKLIKYIMSTCISNSFYFIFTCKIKNFSFSKH